MNKWKLCTQTGTANPSR